MPHHEQRTQQEAVANLDKGNRHRHLLRAMRQDAQNETTLAVAVAHSSLFTLFYTGSILIKLVHIKIEKKLINIKMLGDVDYNIYICKRKYDYRVPTATLGI